MSIHYLKLAFIRVHSSVIEQSVIVKHVQHASTVSRGHVPPPLPTKNDRDTLIEQSVKYSNRMVTTYRTEGNFGGANQAKYHCWRNKFGQLLAKRTPF